MIRDDFNKKHSKTSEQNKEKKNKRERERGITVNIWIESLEKSNIATLMGLETHI